MTAFRLEFVSTHSRPKAAGPTPPVSPPTARVSTHSRPKAAGQRLHTATCLTWFQHTAARRRLGHRRDSARMRDRFNTQPPEGGWAIGATPRVCETVSTHSRPKAAGPSARFRAYARPFQHTAARRRLGRCRVARRLCIDVSTHSRPKAAGDYFNYRCSRIWCFNTQPPEGGWI